MIQIVEQTKEEKIAMYMKCNKKALAEMLWACNVIIDTMKPVVTEVDVKKIISKVSERHYRA